MCRRRRFRYLPNPLSDKRPGTFWEQIAGHGGESQCSAFLLRFDGFEPFGQGHSPVAQNLMVKRENGVDWFAFDYEYTVTISSGQSSTDVAYPNSWWPFSSRWNSRISPCSRRT